MYNWGRLSCLPHNASSKSKDQNIEILSPEQSANRIIGNILHCLKPGYNLGWLIDPSDRSVIVFQPKQQPELLSGQDALIVLRYN